MNSAVPFNCRAEPTVLRHQSPFGANAKDDNDGEQALTLPATGEDDPFDAPQESADDESGCVDVPKPVKSGLFSGRRLIGSAKERSEAKRDSVSSAGRGTESPASATEGDDQTDGEAKRRTSQKRVRRFIFLFFWGGRLSVGAFFVSVNVHVCSMNEKRVAVI